MCTRVSWPSASGFKIPSVPHSFQKCLRVQVYDDKVGLMTGKRTLQNKSYLLTPKQSFTLAECLRMPVWRRRTNEVGVPRGHNYHEVLQRHVKAPPLTQQRWRGSAFNAMFSCVQTDEPSDLIIDWVVMQELRMCFAQSLLSLKMTLYKQLTLKPPKLNNICSLRDFVCVSPHSFISNTKKMFEHLGCWLCNPEENFDFFIFCIFPPVMKHKLEGH